MTTEVSVFKAAGLPAVGTLAKALKAVDAGSIGGVVILKMDKTGIWAYGADATEVEEGSKWAVNPFSFVHGFIAWGEGAPLAEKMVPISDPLPEQGAAPQGATRGWEYQLGFSLKCISGEDEGLEVRYAASSTGGKLAVQALGTAIGAHIEEDQTTPVAVITLQSDSYKHKKYGKVYTPVFKIGSYVSLNGTSAAAAKAEPEADKTPPARRARR
jgi:hypothetical protein